MAPKRQSAILPQPKKPRPVAAPKLEDKSASPGLPKGGKFLHCVSLVIESVVVFFCPPSPNPSGDETLTNTRESFLAGAAGNEVDVGDRSKKARNWETRAQGTSSGPGHHVGPSLSFPAPKLSNGASVPVNAAARGLPTPPTPSPGDFKPALIVSLLLKPPAHNSGLNYCHLV